GFGTITDGVLKFSTGTVTSTTTVEDIASALSIALVNGVGDALTGTGAAFTFNGSAYLFVAGDTAVDGDDAAVLSDDSLIQMTGVKAEDLYFGDIDVVGGGDPDYFGVALTEFVV